MKRISNCSLTGTFRVRIWNMSCQNKICAWFLITDSPCSQLKQVTYTMSLIFCQKNFEISSLLLMEQNSNRISSITLSPKVIALINLTLIMSLSLTVITGCYCSLRSIGLFKSLMFSFIKSHIFEKANERWFLERNKSLHNFMVFFFTFSEKCTVYPISCSILKPRLSRRLKKNYEMTSTSVMQILRILRISY